MTVCWVDRRAHDDGICDGWMDGWMNIVVVVVVVCGYDALERACWCCCLE